MFPLYRNQSIDLLTNQLTGFNMMATLVFNELKRWGISSLEAGYRDVFRTLSESIMDFLCENSR